MRVRASTLMLCFTSASPELESGDDILNGSFEDNDDEVLLIELLCVRVCVCVCVLLLISPMAVLSSLDIARTHFPNRNGSRSNRM